jgi:hypothetical protein
MYAINMWYGPRQVPCSSHVATPKLRACDVGAYLPANEPLLAVAEPCVACIHTGACCTANKECNFCRVDAVGVGAHCILSDASFLHSAVCRRRAWVLGG